MEDTPTCQNRRINRAKQRTAAKVDPSFKSKRYRDKLRTEVKALESLIPVDRPALNRKLDSQTVYRLVIAYLRLKAFFRAANNVSKKEEQTTRLGSNDDKLDDNLDGDIPLTPGDQRVKQEALTNAEFQTLNFQRSLDGFALMLSIDGTIMFATENIVQLLGFNQVDLVHRCVYGVVHPGDQAEVRDVLENRGNFSYQRTHFAASQPASRTKSSDEVGESVAVNFCCRLRCYNRNSPGYNKFHVTGKLQHVATMPKSPKISPRVALLYFRPFLSMAGHQGGETSRETNLGLFWSKHDLDLKISAVEDRVTSVLGYQATELYGTSLYQLVHPDDLCLLVQVHRTITELNEIQSFYLRLQDKGGNWVWLHSKGKVICKNSKKFSIVFTHTPLREDDNIFTDHETLLRRKYSSHNLMSLSEPPSSVKSVSRPDMFHPDPTIDQNIHGHHTHLNCYVMRQPFLSSADDCPINNEITSILGQSDFSMGACPSTWHINSERHSPVVPSSHTAHKLSYRDKHFQVLEKKRVQPEIPNPKASVLANTSGYTWAPYAANEHMILDRRIQMPNNSRNFENNVQHFESFPSYVPRMNSCAGKFCYVDSCHSAPYNYPPSPPPSPRLPGQQYCHGYQPGENHGNNVTLGYSYQPGINSFPHSQMVNQPHGNHGNERSYQSHASIRVSMICNSNINYYAGTPGYTAKFVHKIPSMLNTTAFSYHGNSANQRHGQPDPVKMTNHIKPDPSNSQSCSLNQDASTNQNDCRQFDIEASIHMRIVESEGKGDNGMAEVNLPVPDSFMDYLNS